MPAKKAATKRATATSKVTKATRRRAVSTKKAVKSPRAAGARQAKAPAAKSPSKAAATRVAGRRTGIPMSEGDAGVQAYIAGLPAWQVDIARRIDQLIVREVPHVRKAVKWSTPMYGVAGQGWFAGVGGLKSYVKVNFFAGASLKPVPPSGEGKAMRSVDIREGELDERQMASWVKQAAELPGWGKA